ncbi:MAG: hypothetical protein KAJ91_00205 [Candidatus Aenigmarchaeota archaeon]|nr:hypothetical protein [Candidatus Aenigmarchaeota archaeon]
MSLTYLALKFILGGAIIVGVGLLANIHPKWGGMLAVAPIITTLSILFVCRESGIEITQRMIVWSVVYLAPCALFLGTVYYMNARTNIHVGVAILCGYLIWMIGVVTLQKIIPAI